MPTRTYYEEDDVADELLEVTEKQTLRREEAAARQPQDL
jgi:hypothetical protein